MFAGRIVERRDRIAACCLISTILSAGILISLGLEGILCCLAAIPLMALPMMLGACAGANSRSASGGCANTAVLLICPLLLTAADFAERPFRSACTERFDSSMWLPCTPERAWSLVVEMDAMRGDRPFLMSLGLPEPRRCILDRHAAGGQRVCYFDDGRIVQVITDWQPARSLELRITENTLPGRKWLTFLDAGYTFTAENGGTRLTRHTRISSAVFPRWYWRPLERWGVTSEHEYIFSHLARAAAGTD